MERKKQDAQKRKIQLKIVKTATLIKRNYKKRVHKISREIMNQGVKQKQKIYTNPKT